MKAYRIEKYIGPAGLRLVEEADPASPVGRQVVVRIRATSINNRDLSDLHGKFGLPLDHIPMCDGAGEVVAVGPDVTRVRPGQRVAAIFHRNWIAGDPPRDLKVLGRGAEKNDGMLAECTLTDESELVLLPEHLSFEEGATLPCAGVTAWYALFGKDTLRPGQTVLVQGTGGVSIFALQLARRPGCSTDW